MGCVGPAELARDDGSCGGLGVRGEGVADGSDAFGEGGGPVGFGGLGGLRGGFFGGSLVIQSDQPFEDLFIAQRPRPAARLKHGGIQVIMNLFEDRHQPVIVNLPLFGSQDLGGRVCRLCGRPGACDVFLIRAMRKAS